MGIEAIYLRNAEGAVVRSCRTMGQATTLVRFYRTQGRELKICVHTEGSCAGSPQNIIIKENTFHEVANKYLLGGDGS